MGFFQLAVLLTALGQTGTITATPAQLVAASDAQVELTLAVDPVPPPGTPVRFDTFGVGVVSEAKEEKPGRYKATLRPPKDRYPQLVIVRAAVAGRNVWTTVPVLGIQTVKITTKPNARVDVVVGALHFPSDKPADSAGRIDVTIQVPPGIDVARVRSTDPLGNKTDKPLPLDPPEFVRVRAAPVGRDAVASWADKDPLPLELFGVQRDGSALSPNAAVVLELEDKAEGAVDVPKLVKPGLWTSQFRASTKVGDRKAILLARLKERGAPLSKPGALEVQLRAGSPVAIAIRSEKPLLHPDEPSTRIFAVGTDAQANEVGAVEELTTDFGKVEREGEAFALTIPQQLGAQRAATLTAKAGEVTKVFSLPLKPGPPSMGTVVFADQKVRAGEQPLKGTVTLKDARGNPVMGAKLEFASERGQAELVREVGGGTYEVQFVADPASETGATALLVSVADAPVKLSAPLIILPGIRPGTTSVGLLAGGRKNFGPLVGASATLDVGVHPMRLPLEITGALTYAYFPRASVPVSPDANVQGQFQTLQLAAGARYSFPLTARGALYASAGAGAQLVLQNVALEVADNARAPEAPTAFSPIARAALGFSQRLGPGRFAVELGYGVELFRWEPSQEEAMAATNPDIASWPPVTANLGGVQLLVGYLFQVR